MYGHTCGLQPKLRSNDFTASAQFEQPPGGAISSCIGGQTISLDVILSIKSNSPSRYAAGVFFGQNGNLPSLTTPPPANMCSLGVFPSSPALFANLDGSPACGDFVSGGVATLQVSKIKVACTPAPGSNQLSIPYAVAWDNQATPLCTPNNLTAATNAKCIESGSGFVAGVTVQGYIKLTKATSPASTTQTFVFSTASNPVVTATPASFTLSSGGSQTITFPISYTATQQAQRLTQYLSPTAVHQMLTERC